ncbi:MAG: hypothetical protein ACP5QI_04215 [Candidatus Bathyarchaeia archaeon]
MKADAQPITTINNQIKSILVQFRDEFLTKTGLISFLTPFMGYAVNIDIPVIGGEFAAGAATSIWIVSSYLIAPAVLVVQFGRRRYLWKKKDVYIQGNCFHLLVRLRLRDEWAEARGEVFDLIAP